MVGLLRYVLAGCLTLALTAGGVPSVRAAVAGPSQPSIHAHADTAASMMHHEATSDMKRTGMHARHGAQAPAEKSVDPCKDMKCCTMCATAYIEPLSRIAMPTRVALAVRYDLANVSLTEAPVLLDPGIPIAA